MRIHLILIFIVLFTISCKRKVESTISGWWSIDTIYYNNLEIEGCLLSNSIIFEKGNCELPITENYCGSDVASFDITGDWKIDKNEIGTFLFIQTENKLFNGNHHIRFFKDEKNKLLMLELKSDSLYLICRKGLFDYDREINLINDLVKSTN